MSSEYNHLEAMRNALAECKKMSDALEQIQPLSEVDFWDWVFAGFSIRDIERLEEGLCLRLVELDEEWAKNGDYNLS